MQIPVLGRLSFADYIRLVFAFSIMIFEPVLRVIFAVLPLKWLVDYTRKRLDSFGHKQTATKFLTNKRTENELLKLSTTHEFATFW